MTRSTAGPATGQAAGQAAGHATQGPWTTRRATPADAAAVTELRALMFSDMGVPGVDDPGWREAATAWFVRELGGSRACVVLAEDADGTVVAGAMAGLRFETPSPVNPNGVWGLVNNVATLPEARRQGLARAASSGSSTGCVTRPRPRWSSSSPPGRDRACMKSSASPRPPGRRCGCACAPDARADSAGAGLAGSVRRLGLRQLRRGGTGGAVRALGLRQLRRGGTGGVGSGPAGCATPPGRDWRGLGVAGRGPAGGGARRARERDAPPTTRGPRLRRHRR